VLRRYNATAPVFRSKTVAGRWCSADGSALAGSDLPADIRAIAFCGLGNPQAFWRTLSQVEIEPLASYDYGDHHRYTPLEIRRLARHAQDIGAEALLTTAKDVVNLDPEYPAIIGSLKLYWIEVRTEIEGREELLNLIRKL
jgi:tetraacyldisaccharide 4'-kinase